jgi:hypothetical protein
MPTATRPPTPAPTPAVVAPKPPVYAPAPPTAAPPTTLAPTKQPYAPEAPPKTMLVDFFLNVTLIIPGDMFVDILGNATRCSALCPRLKLALILDIAACLGIDKVDLRINIMMLDNSSNLRVEITVTAHSLVTIAACRAAVIQMPNNASALTTTTAELRSAVSPNVPSVNVTKTIITSADVDSETDFLSAAFGYSLATTAALAVLTASLAAIATFM